MKNPYAVLGLDRKASQEEIAQAYRSAAKAHHPDRNPGDAEAANRFKEIQEAYDILRDAASRSDYDRHGGMNFRRREQDPLDPFMDMAAQVFTQGRFRGRNLQVRLEIELQEAATGCTKEIVLKTRDRCSSCKGFGSVGEDPCGPCTGTGRIRVTNAPFQIESPCVNCGGTGRINPKPCADCAGTGSKGDIENRATVHVPPGVDTGMSIRMPGLGEESLNGGKRGDVVVFIVVKDHPLFARDGIDLNIEIPVSYTQLALGAELGVPGLFGETMTVKVPAGTQSHGKLKLKGKGLRAPNGMQGDLMVSLKVETPKSLTDEHRELLTRLSEIEAACLTPKREAWKKNIEGPTT